MIRVLIVDDHPALRAGLQSMLAFAEDLEVVGSAAGGRTIAWRVAYQRVEHPRSEREEESVAMATS